METEAVPVTKSAKFRHFAFGYASAFQLDAIGTQLKTVVKKVASAARPLKINNDQIAILTFLFCPVRRSRKRRIDVFTRARIGL